MAKFRKPVLAAGRYRTRSGEWLDATPERLQSWSDKFRAMRADGIKLPLAWGHQPLAEPIDPFADPNDPEVKARREFGSSAYCAGQLDDIEYDPASKTLYASGNAPGADIDKEGNLLAWVKMADGTQLRSAVNEVSIGVNNWVDGKGRLHEDVPIHLALCVRPVAHGLGGFLALSTDTRLPCPPGHEVHCSATGCECRPVPFLAFSSQPAGPLIEMAGWVNSATGKVRYQANAPRSRDGSTWAAKPGRQPGQQAAPPQQPAAPQQAPAQQPAQPAGQPGQAATTPMSYVAQTHAALHAGQSMQGKGIPEQFAERAFHRGHDDPESVKKALIVGRQLAAKVPPGRHRKGSEHHRALNAALDKHFPHGGPAAIAEKATAEAAAKKHIGMPGLAAAIAKHAAPKQGQSAAAPTAKKQPPANQAALLSKVRKEVQHRDLNDSMRSLQGVSVAGLGVHPKVADQFDAHGTNSLGDLTKLLNHGIDKSREFYSGTLNRTGKGQGVELKDDQSFVVLGHPGKSIKEGGIGGVLVDDLHAPNIEHLRQAFPGTKFLTRKEAAGQLAKVAASSSKPPKGPAAGKKAAEIPVASPANDAARNVAEAKRVAAQKQGSPSRGTPGLSGIHQTLLSGKAIAPAKMPPHVNDKTARTAWGKGFLQKAFKRGHRSPQDIQKAHGLVKKVMGLGLKGKELAQAMNATLSEHFPITGRARDDKTLGHYSELSAELLLAAEHAPKGGITIAGKAFRGGQFIPAAVMAQASPEEKQKLEATKSAGREKLKAHVGERGPDSAALREKLGQYANLELKDHQVKGARRLYNGIKSYHGDLSLHRIHQLIHEDEAKLENAKPADKQRLYRRLKGYHHMLDWHEQGAEKAAAAEKASRAGVQNVPFEQLHVDPERFQYKLNTGKSGVVREGSALEGVKRFRPEFAGAILVWHDPADRKTYVVNGHHRHDLAKKAGRKDMAVLYMEAKDAKEARKIGALANIAEGRGTAVDAAKLIRDEQFKPEDFQAEGVSLKGPQARDAFVLAKLSEGLFSKLVRGQLDQKQALAIAGIESHEHQHQFADWLAKQDRDIPDRVLQRMAQKIQNTSGVKTKTAGLFGEEENDENLFLHRATLETHALAKLSAEANLFGAVSSDKKAAKLQSKVGDNQLDVEKNREVADEARQHRALLAKLVDRKGTIADAFNAAAEELYREPKKRKQIEERLLEAVRGLVKREVGGKPAAAAGSGAAPGGTREAREGERPSPAERRTERVKPEFMPSAAQRTKPAAREKIPTTLKAEKRPYKYPGSTALHDLEHGDTPVTRLDPKDLIATQDYLWSDKSDAIEGDIERPLQVVRHKGKHYIEEGHHRAASALKSGKKVPAKILEVD